MANKEIKCSECERISIPDYSKWGCTPNLCDECLAIGWSDDPQEVYDAISNDPELGKLVDRQSPYF